MPLSYLAWLFENLGGRPDVREAARAEIERRVTWGHAWAPVPLDMDKVKRIYRELAFQFHPDHGGDTGVMQGINIFYKLITE